jgi:adenylylsulfate kinase-like enzyme
MARRSGPERILLVTGLSGAGKSAFDTDRQGEQEAKAAGDRHRQPDP